LDFSGLGKDDIKIEKRIAKVRKKSKKKELDKYQKVISIFTRVRLEKLR